MQEVAVMPKPKRFPRLRTAAYALLFLIALAAGVWLARVPLLQGAAQLWIVSDRVTAADAVAVLGGGLDTRPFAAAKYYHQRLASRILVAETRTRPAEEIGAVASDAQAGRQVLLKLGVPAEAVENFGSGLASTFDEAQALRAWAERTRARSLIVPTEIFSSRRVRWMLERAFEGSDVRVQVPAVEDPYYTRADWWLDVRGLVAFQNEVIKYVYYRCTY